MKTRLKLTVERELGFVPKFEDKPCRIIENFLYQDYKKHVISHLFKGKRRKTDVKKMCEYGIQYGRKVLV